MLRISWVAAQLAASQEELSSMSDSVEWWLRIMNGYGWERKRLYSFYGNIRIFACKDSGEQRNMSPGRVSDIDRPNVMMKQWLPDSHVLFQSSDVALFFFECSIRCLDLVLMNDRIHVWVSQFNKDYIILVFHNMGEPETCTSVFSWPLIFHWIHMGLPFSVKLSLPSLNLIRIAKKHIFTYFDKMCETSCFD
jgi:hypothetical protein